MKRLLVIIASFALVGCSVMRNRVVETQFLDFRPYAEEGFFISPDPYLGDFESIGEIVIKVTPAILPRDKVNSDRKYGDGVYASSGLSERERISGAELTDLIVKAAMEKGADGIADFQFRAVYSYAAKYEILSHYEVSGLAIKRK